MNDFFELLGICLLIITIVFSSKFFCGDPDLIDKILCEEYKSTCKEFEAVK